MRGWLVLGPIVAAAIACTNPPPPQYPYPEPYVPEERLASANPDDLGQLDDRLVDFVFDGGQIEFEMYRNGDRIVQIARSRYAVPMMISWSITSLDNLEATTPASGVAFLPAAPSPLGIGKAIVLAELRQPDLSQRYHRHLAFRARFGDPRAVPKPYDYALPYPHGLTFAVLQGFHGAFSHKGSNEFAVDFDCPVATPVLAAREGTIVAAHAAAQGSGTTPDYLDYRRTNFVIVMHDDGTLGEYMHLAPSSVDVKPGQRIERRQILALSGSTGFSSTPHLHFQVMTAADDGIAARSFPFQLAIRPDKVEEPVLGRRYSAWE
jgi:murein DD-endopeptidase MepM/ murein hydrolase activator NlpD